jgi:hypothetical protein
MVSNIIYMYQCYIRGKVNIFILTPQNVSDINSDL